MNMTAIKLFEAGWTDLVSVVPPDGKLSPLSKIKLDSRGKVPGRVGNHGWAGYDWKTSETTLRDAQDMDTRGANIGMKAKHFPAVDIDCTDESISRIIGDMALQVFGPAPCRIGKPPKRLLMYRSEVPFGRMRLWIKQGGASHLVEVLADGQQYVIAGMHPSTRLPYTWDQELTSIEPKSLPVISRDQVDQFFDGLVEQLAFLDCVCEREGNGTAPTEHPAVGDQASLKAPSLQALREAVSFLPNDVPGYEQYITFGIAVKAAGQDDPSAALEIFQDWAARWEGGENVSSSVQQDWAKMRSPFRIGWNWIAERARHYGYLDAAEEFTVTSEPEPELGAPVAHGTSPVEFSDAANAAKLIKIHGHEIKYCDALGGWLVWDGRRWVQDETMQVHCWAGEILQEASNAVSHRPDFNAAKVDKISERLASNAARNNCVSYARVDRRVVAKADQFDADLWALNTPDGIIDLKTGDMRDRKPGELVIRSTAVSPLYGEPPVRFLKFLREAVGADEIFLAYLKRLSGYCLTGQVSEQQLSFFHGNGGNGKSLFVVGVLAAVMGDYAKKSQMETFTASSSDRHPTELASLRGSRLVYASETQTGRRWNESRIKELTGGEPVTARMMHKDEFTYIPQFKLMFLGNHRPELREIDDGIKRRLHLIPFTRTPAKVDRDLEAKLKEEWPAILAWMIEGCLEWQVEGLNAPPAVTIATDEYFEDEDAVGRWLRERCMIEPTTAATSSGLYEDWRAWCGENGEHAGSQKRLSTALKTRGFQRWREPSTGRQGFKGIELIYNAADFGVFPAAKHTEVV